MAKIEIVLFKDGKHGIRKTLKGDTYKFAKLQYGDEFKGWSNMSNVEYVRHDDLLPKLKVSLASLIASEDIGEPIV